jgi:biopolymer transport protein ExbD
MRMRQEHSKSARLICRIDVIAFAGVMFALVAMFLLPATIVVDSPRSAAGLPVEMAKTSHPITLRGANREDAMLVAVQRDGRIWFDRDQITPDQLPLTSRAACRMPSCSGGRIPKMQQSNEIVAFSPPASSFAILA